MFIFLNSMITSQMTVKSLSVNSYEKPIAFPIANADPISILNDAGLEVYPGSGTEGDPYVIRDLVIDTAMGTGIYIQGTTHYFEIINCTVKSALVGININLVTDGTVEIWNCTIDSGDTGIYIYDVDYAEVFNNTIVDTSVGISYDLCGLSYIYNNTISGAYRGIFVEDSNHPYVKCNNIYNITQEGILAQYSDGIVIQYNTVSDCNVGIDVYGCYDPYIGYNYVSDTDSRGIYSRYSDYARIGGNEFHACGLGVHDSNLDDLLTARVTTNYIDGRLIYYAENLTSTLITTKYSQIILVNCSDTQI